MGNEVVLSTGQKNSCQSGACNAWSFCQRDDSVLVIHMPDSVRVLSPAVG
jgi:hypothetical protein